MISRRSLLSLITSATAEAGVPEAQAQTIAAPATKTGAVDPLAVIPVLLLNGRLSDRSRHHLEICWKRITEGTAFEGRQLLVLEEGARLELVGPAARPVGPRLYEYARSLFTAGAKGAPRS